MSEDVFNFILYRINKVSEDTLWSISKSKNLETDQDIRDYLAIACEEKFDTINETERNKYKWSLRKGTSIADENDNVIIDAYILAKSFMEKDALIVDDVGFHEDRSISYPPPADAMVILIYWPRHIALVENRSAMTTGETWLRHYTEILHKVYVENEWNKFPKLENIPPANEIMSVFNSMEKVYRVKLNIKLPNPDMSRMTRYLIGKLQQDSIQELKQDMFSPTGLSKQINGLPHASLSIAEHGYKDGPVVVEGIKDGEYKKVETGLNTTKGGLNGLKAFIRGLKQNIKTKEGKSIIEAVENELNELVPRDE